MLKSLFAKIRNRQPYIEQPLTIDESSDFTWDHETDLAIAGFGGAGATAAIEAHDQGLETLVIDRFSGGGATNISGGIFYAGGGTRIQKAAGVEDSSENMFNYLKHEVGDAVKASTLRRFCQQSVDNFNFMEANGVPFDASPCPFKTSYPPNHYFFYYSGNESFAPYNTDATPAARGHRGHRKGISGRAIYEPLKQSVTNRGINVLTGTKLVALITNSDGEVKGFKAIQIKNNRLARFGHKLLGYLQVLLRYVALFWPPLFNLLASMAESLEKRCGESIYVKARRGVVLATGGFYGNQQMIKEYAPKYLNGSPLGTLTDDGSGIQMAMQLNAKVKYMDKVSAWRFINPPAAFAKGVLVGPSGQRICNEMLYGAQVGDRMMQHHDGKAWVIINEKLRKAAYKDLTLKKGIWFHLVLGALYLWFDCKKGQSLPELARKLDIPEDTLTTTITDYNALADNQQPDPMGKPNAFIEPITEGPFYAVNASYHYFFVPCPSLTLGGLAVDEDSGQVLDNNDKPINGLYAIGRTAVGIASQGYVSGLSIADCVFSGRRAAKHAAQSVEQATEEDVTQRCA